MRKGQDYLDSITGGVGTTLTPLGLASEVQSDRYSGTLYRRIVERDVRAAADRVEVAPAISGPTGEPPPEPLSRIRQVIAARLTESVTTIPQFSVTVPVDVTAIVALQIGRAHV